MTHAPPVAPTPRPWPPLWFGGNAPRSRSAVLLDRALAGLGWTALIGIWLFPFSASGLIAPGWAVLVVHALWTAHALLAARISHRRPRLVPLVALQALLVWYAFLTLGAAVLGWNP
ncbi:hypothetical protein [Euzebya rosea]|uniref:hypothetical protein n=1 Tax=Euzebya rosea TaxID=2052804 RepID=UPI000D3EC2DE|nr:hypothetical protein [Euzebya rosea]